MQISLRQSGGTFGGERSVRISEQDVEVSHNGVAASRTMSPDESASVGDLVEQLVRTAPSGDFQGDPYASDVQRTEVEIGAADGSHTYRVQSGAEAPMELWRLVGKLGEVADRKDGG